MIELKRTAFQFKLDGNSYTVKKPTVRQIEELQKQAKDNQEDLSAAINLLDMLGMPKEVSYDMEAEHLQTILEHITGQSLEKK